MVFLRGVEQRMRRHPSLAALADAAGAQFIDDEVAEFVFVSLIPEIDRQAMAAKRDGSASLTPGVHGKPQVLAHAAGLMERWSEWLRLGARQGMGTTVFEAMGLPAPPVEVVRLLTWMAEQLCAQTGRHAASLSVGVH